MAWVDFFSIMKDIALSASAITGACVAVIGLNAWKQQLAGQSEYELARRILVSLYQYRDAVAWVRNPLMLANEMTDDDGEASMKTIMDHFEGIARAYEKRWEKLIEARSGLDGKMLEAEVIWGPALKNLMKNINGLQTDLLIAIRDKIALQDQNSDKEYKKILMKRGKERRKILYGNRSEDEFDRKLRDHIQEIEKYLKPRLKLKD